MHLFQDIKEFVAKAGIVLSHNEKAAIAGATIEHGDTDESFIRDQLKFKNPDPKKFLEEIIRKTNDLQETQRLSCSHKGHAFVLSKHGTQAYYSDENGVFMDKYIYPLEANDDKSLKWATGVVNLGAKSPSTRNKVVGSGAIVFCHKAIWAKDVALHSKAVPRESDTL